MGKRNKKKKLLIIIIIVALLLVGVGLVIAINLKPDKETKKDEEIKDTRCVGSACISNVSVVEIEGTKSIKVVLKNEGNEVIENSCVNLISGIQKYVICLNNAKANEEVELNLEYSESSGQKIEDYSLEKASEEDAQEANKKREEILNNLK